jgi:hypothetical protein
VVTWKKLSDEESRLYRGGDSYSESTDLAPEASVSKFAR